MRPLLRQVAIIVLVSAAALAALRFAGRWLVPQEPERSPAETPQDHDDAGPPGSIPGTTVGSGQVAGEPWRLVVDLSGPCVRLVTADSATGACGRGDLGVQLIRGRIGDSTYLFGAAPGDTARLWVASADGRLIDGDVFPAPRGPEGRITAYMVSVEGVRSAAVVAVDDEEVVTGYGRYSSAPGRPPAVIDAYGNLIGLARAGPWLVPLPGRPAALSEVRAFLFLSLTDVHSGVAAWWEGRPPPRGGRAAVLKRWWDSYPLTEGPG